MLESEARAHERRRTRLMRACVKEGAENGRRNTLSADEPAVVGLQRRRKKKMQRIREDAVNFSSLDFPSENRLHSLRSRLECNVQLRQQKELADAGFAG